ncbi:acyltransferase [Anaerobacillus sp. CMMVII]|uniref:acyltransferase n=1 Tax=Anaerobacillus sp. CMMVII TaxID=2755588 RepID=UPI0021B7E1A2|nr:acyltransferase [Anaerobacillus sp. CMMVII]MCT8137639.1 acyltransferase [Anaerobacillus sp. CMMVII]
MNFELLLDKLLGQREIIHEVECSVCGDFETYFRDPITKENLGRACEHCVYVEKF